MWTFLGTSSISKTLFDIKIANIAEQKSMHLAASLNIIITTSFLYKLPRTSPEPPLKETRSVTGAGRLSFPSAAL